MLHVSGASEGVRGRPESPRERFTPTESSAANQICGPNYVSCECRRTLFPALRMVCPRQKMRSDGFCALLLSSAAPGSSLRAEWDAVPIFPSLTRENCPCRGSAPVPARAPPRFFRACEEKLSSPGQPRPGLRNALRVWFTALFGPAASLSCFLHSVACGGVGCRGTPLPLRVWIYNFVRPRRITKPVSCTSLLAAELRRPRSDQGHAPATPLPRSYSSVRDVRKGARGMPLLPKTEYSGKLPQA